MKQFILVLLTLAVTANAISPGYRYQQPQRQQQQPVAPAGIRPPQPQSNNGIYSTIQSPPLQQYSAPAPQHFQQQAPQSAPAAISLPGPPPPAPNEIAVPAPIPAQLPLPAPAPQLLSQTPPPQPPQQYLAPQQQQQQQQQQQVYSQQQQYVQQQQQSVQAVASIPQSHQSQVVQQQLSQPIQNAGFQQNFQSYQRPQQAIITKDIFIHSAPEDHDSDADLGPQYDSGPVRKNYRIVFIKAPSQNLRGAAAALKRAQNNNEEKTIIYVLSKKPDLQEVHQQLQQVQGEHKVSKPEVYFIKYKTQEEAQRAQQEIQAQYDALGGSTHISDEGVAPVTTVGGAGVGVQSGAAQLSGPISAGNAGASYSQGAIQQQSFVQQSYQSQSGAGVSQKYLPAKALVK